MAAKSLYPRATVKKIVKAHSRRPLSKNVDILVRYGARENKTQGCVLMAHRYF